MTPRISVVIPTHDKLAQLRSTLAALGRQDLEPSAWEVLVVDDGSTDGTGNWLTAEVERWSGRLRVVSPGRNLGRAAARNLGGMNAAGEWILFMDDDIVAPPGLLSAHLKLLEANSGKGVIGLVRTAPGLVDGPHFHYIDSRGVAKIREGLVPARYLVTQNTAVPRSDFVAVGGFDEEFMAYGFEDMEMGFRLEEERGVSFVALREPITEHVHHHGLDLWLAKKRECGHGPLQRVAATHPTRLQEMGLHWVIDAPGCAPAPVYVRMVRALARSPLSNVLIALAGCWPTRCDCRPYLFPLYARLLDILVLSAYCRGLSDPGFDDLRT